MAISVNDVIRVTYFERLFEQRLLTVLHLRCVAAPAAGTTDAVALQNVANRFGDVAQAPLTSWRPLIAADLVWDEVRAQKVFPTRTVYQKDAIGVAGTHADPCEMPNLAMSIEKRTLHAGRKGVGRIQMGGVPNSVIENGMFTVGYLNAAQLCWESILGDITIAADSSIYRVCLWDGDTVTSEDDLFDVQAKDTVRTMHRRTLRVGI